MQDPKQFEADLAALYDGLPCGHLSLLPNGMIVKANQTMLRWMGYSKDEIVFKKRFQDLLGLGDRIFYDTHFGPLLQMQRSANEINFSIRKKDGTKFPALVTACEVQDERGKPILIRIALFQIHDRKRYESELLLERKKAEQALRAKTDFVSLLTHEIRTPLNSIIGVSHLLATTTLNEDQKRFSDMLLGSSENLLRLLNSILDYSKVDSGKANVESTVFEFERSIRTTALGFQGLAVRKGIGLVVEIPADIPTFVRGDQVKVTQMVNNLIGNAIKFTHSGTVTLRLEKVFGDDHYADILFKIIDTGIGIPENIIPKIFEEYSQADEATGLTYGGTGLGLAIVHRLASLLGSRVNVVSEVGKGSTFSFQLRLRSATELDAVKKTPTGNDRSLAGLRVLVADDSEDNQMILELTLRGWGIKVTQALNGQEVLEKLNGCDYDLILMDLRMPVLDGYATTAAIRKIPDAKCASVPIIAFSASATLGERDIVSNLQFQDVLGKPYKPSDLFEKIARHARR